MYRDKSKEQEATKERVRRYRDKALHQGVTSKGVTPKGVTSLGDPYDLLNPNYFGIGGHRHRAPEDTPINLPEGISERLGNITDKQLKHLAEYISTPCPGMPRLERLQRIAGSLSKKYQDQAWFGCGDTALNFKEIAGILGELPPLYGYTV